MNFKDPIGIIELGNVNIKCLIFKINNNNSEILSTSTTLSEGFHNDVVVNLAKASNTIRSCIKINSFSDFIKTYQFWKKIYKKKFVYNSINDYSPKLARGGKLIPYLIKNKTYLLAIIVAFLFSRKRYF